MGFSSKKTICGDPFNQYGEATDNGGTLDCDFNKYTVPAGKTLLLTEVRGTFQETGEFFVRHEGTVIERSITSVADSNFSLNFWPAKPIAAGEVIEVCFCSDCPGKYNASIIGSLF